MARRTGTNRPRAALERKPVGRGGSLFTGLFLGVAAGLLLAAGLAWYFYVRPGDFKAAEPGPGPEPVRTDPPPALNAEPPALEVSPPPALPRPASPALPAPEAGARAKERQDADYSFYDILPGDKPTKPTDAPLVREVWWLQVAALKAKADADALKARLSLLGLAVTVNPVASPAGPLHRVRVGPFKTEDDALGALDTLAVNNYEPRLFKEKLNP